MARRTTLVAVWLAGTALSVAMGWGAVSLVRSNVDLTSATDDVRDDIVEMIASTPPGISPSPSPSPSPSGSAAPARSAAPSSTAAGRPTLPRQTARTFSLRGGTVEARCAGARITLGYATPRAGFEVEVNDDDPGELSVRFRSDAHESRLDATCVNGSPSGRVRENAR